VTTTFVERSNQIDHTTRLRARPYYLMYKIILVPYAVHCHGHANDRVRVRKKLATRTLDLSDLNPKRGRNYSAWPSESGKRMVFANVIP